MEILIKDNVEKLIFSLDKNTIAKSLRTIDLLERFGDQLELPHSKKIRANLFELRIRGQQEVRFFYTFQQNKIFLLHGFIKKSQKIPQKELKQAIQILKNLT